MSLSYFPLTEKSVSFLRTHNIAMTPFEVYQDYLAIKRHFNSTAYDYFKANGKTKCSRESFDKRKDKYFFQKLARLKDPKLMLVYNFVESDAWIGDIVINEEALANYRKHKKFNQSLSYEFKNELRHFDSLSDIVQAEQRTHPKAIRLFLQGKLSLETMVILIDILRPISYWKRMLPEDQILEEIIFRVSKYNKFMYYDRNKMKTELKGVLN